MKTFISILFVSIFLLVSCQKSTDKKAQLDKLIKERDLLTQKINKLREDINKKDSSNSNLPLVAVTEIKPAIFRHYIEVQGKIDGESNISVNPRTLGVITNIYVKQGDFVRSGQILAQLDDQVLRQSLEEVKTQLVFATNLYIKQKNLWDQKIGSEIQYLTAKNNKESMENRLRTIQDQIDMCKITSPINGTVEDIPVKVGQSVAPGFGVFRVINFSTIKIVAEVAETYSSRINSGDSVLVFLPDLSKEIPAKISFSSKYINPVNRTFIVEVRLKPDQIEFRENMIANLKINDYKSNAFVVPVNTLQESQEGKYVYLIEKKSNKSYMVKRNVVVGSSYNGKIEILKGLNEGDLIITTGFQDLNSGTEVKY